MDETKNDHRKTADYLNLIPKTPTISSTTPPLHNVTHPKNNKNLSVPVQIAQHRNHNNRKQKDNNIINPHKETYP